jgi:hypothetical protein
VNVATDGPSRVVRAEVEGSRTPRFAGVPVAKAGRDGFRVLSRVDSTAKRHCSAAVNQACRPRSIQLVVALGNVSAHGELIRINTPATR